VLGMVLYERNELEEAARRTQLSIKLSELTGYAEHRTSAYCLLAQVLLANGEVARAEEEMEKGDEASRQSHSAPLDRARHAADRVLFAIQLGDLAAALEWGSRLSEFSLDSLLFLQHVPVRLLIARGEKAAAAEQLVSLYERAMQGGAQGYAIRIRLYQAIAAATQDQAVGFVADALKMERPEGFIRTFVDEGPLLAPLLRQAIRSGIEPDYARKLLDVIEAEDRLRRIRRGEIPASFATMGPLTEREAEVLRLLAERLSNQEIADKLTISLNTAKTHVRHVFDKLEATDRRQALKRARELRLI